MSLQAMDMLKPHIFSYSGTKSTWGSMCPCELSSGVPDLQGVLDISQRSKKSKWHLLYGLKMKWKCDVGLAGTVVTLTAFQVSFSSNNNIWRWVGVGVTWPATTSWESGKEWDTFRKLAWHLRDSGVIWKKVLGSDGTEAELPGHHT